MAAERANYEPVTEGLPGYDIEAASLALAGVSQLVLFGEQVIEDTLPFKAA